MGKAKVTHRNQKCGYQKERQLVIHFQVYVGAENKTFCVVSALSNKVF
jgi:hypothetical protein